MATVHRHEDRRRRQRAVAVLAADAWLVSGAIVRRDGAWSIDLSAAAADGTTLTAAAAEPDALQAKIDLATKAKGK